MISLLGLHKYGGGRLRGKRSLCVFPIYRKSEAWVGREDGQTDGRARCNT